VRLTTPTAEVLATSPGGAVATRQVRGQGSILFYGEPLEIESGVPLRDVYRTFLRLSRIGRLPVTPDRADIHAFSLSTLDGGEVVVAHNAGEPAEVRVEGKATIDLELAQGLPGLCALNGDGRAVEAEAQGEVTVNGVRVMGATGHVAAVSLDGKPLAQSDALVLMPFTEGTTTLARDAGAADLVAQAGRIEDSHWLAYEDAVPVSRDGAEVRADCGAGTRLEVVLLAPAGKLAEAEHLLMRRTRGGPRPWR